jgi:hypothetical protein
MKKFLVAVLTVALGSFVITPAANALGKPKPQQTILLVRVAQHRIIQVP